MAFGRSESLHSHAKVQSIRPGYKTFLTSSSTKRTLLIAVQLVHKLVLLQSLLCRLLQLEQEKKNDRRKAVEGRREKGGGERRGKEGEEERGQEEKEREGSRERDALREKDRKKPKPQVGEKNPIK